MLSALLRRAAELAVALPCTPECIYQMKVEEELSITSSIRSTESERLVRQRIGQDVYRSALLDYWKGS